MAGPSYRERLELLEALLAEGITLSKLLRESEVRLREQLIHGDHRELADTEQKRHLIRGRIDSLEEKLQELIPPQGGLQAYIKTMIGRSRQAAMLADLDTVREELREIRTINEVNRVLLEERIRFSKELQEIMLARKITYDQKGRLDSREAAPPKNLDRNC